MTRASVHGYELQATYVADQVVRQPFRCILTEYGFSHSGSAKPSPLLAGLPRSSFKCVGIGGGPVLIFSVSRLALGGDVGGFDHPTSMGLVSYVRRNFLVRIKKAHFLMSYHLTAVINKIS